MKLLYPFARRFIAGYDFNSAIKPIQSLIDEGYEVSVNFVGEQNKSYSDCKRAFKEYLRVIKHFKKDKRIEGIQMLVHQAAPCFKEWFGVEPQTNDLDLFKLLYKKMNEK